jgi:type VI protein secretion system component VasF
VDDQNPTLDYATPKGRKGRRFNIVVVALLIFALQAVAFYFWQFSIKRDLDKGIWP